MKKVHLLWLSLALLFTSCSKADEVESLKENHTTSLVAENSYELEQPQDLDVLLKDIGNPRYVLLGEASHGTKEYYTWRAEITKRLIEEKGFNVITVEGDWPDLYKLNQYIKGTEQAGASAEAIMQTFDRWPTWMWANEEMAELTEWLKQHNNGLSASQQVGLYGMDVYSLWDSLDELEQYLRKNNTELLPQLQKVKNCFAPYAQDEQRYGYEASRGTASCADELAILLEDVQKHVAQKAIPTEEDFDASQNALIAANAEDYYSEMYQSNAGSWNIRDRHMVKTINRLVDFYGPSAKVIVWAHNTHIGDARATDMLQSGTVNVGQLVREEQGEENVYAVGFGSYQSTVVAANKWGNPAQIMHVPQGIAGSWEALLHGINPANKVVLMENLAEDNRLTKQIGHRAIGVVYNPGSERGNYVPSVLPERYNAFIFF